MAQSRQVRRRQARKNPILAMVGETVLARWRSDPILAVREIFGAELEPYQAKLLGITLPDTPDRWAMKSAHGVGKTTALALLGWVFLITRENPRVVATAPTKAQLTDALWPEFAKWHAEMRFPELRDAFDISEGHIRLRERPKSWFAVARTSNRPENVQGFHGKHILILVDEASAVPAGVFEVLEGALSNAEFEDDEVLLALTGNPNFTAGEFHDAFTKNANLYERITVSGDPETKFVPRYDGPIENCFVSRRVTAKYRSVIEGKYGKLSAAYDVRVHGQFPKADDWAVISWENAERARYVALPIFDRHRHPVRIVMDVARAGGDKTTCGVFRAGHLIRLRKWAKTSGPQCNDILKEEFTYWTEQGFTVEMVVVDEPGVGGPILDQAKRDGLPAVGYHGGRGLSAAEGDPEDDCRMFANRRARDWWHGRMIFERGHFAISINDDELAEELVAELASVHYDYNQSEKIQVESKKDMKKRLGETASPDLADTVIMGLSKVYSTHAAFAVMLDEDVEMALSGPDRATVEAQLDMEHLW